MSNWIKEILKLAAEAEASKEANVQKGNPNGAFQEPSHIEAARELMDFFHDFEKNPQTRYNALPREVIEQIGLEALFPNEENPFPWMSEMIDLKKERNFFETRVIEYQTGGALSWD